jgi:hypothetical protein
MNTYETSAIVEDLSHIDVAVLPFAPGTHVEVIIDQVENSDGSPAASTADSGRAAS